MHNKLLAIKTGSFLTATLLMLVIAQLSFLIYMVHETYLAGPVQDSWGVMPYIENSFTLDTWFNQELWLAQNSHRPVTTRLEFAIDYYFFQGSNLFLLSICFALLILEAALLLIPLIKNPETPSTIKITTLVAICLVTYPTIAWTFLHIFNIQMLQCAASAFIACYCFSIGLENKKMIWVLAALMVAILCQFTAFSITTLWPTFFFIWIIHRSKKIYLVYLVSVFLISSYLYIFFSFQSTAENQINIIFTDQLVISIQSVFILSFVNNLIHYVITFLTVPPADNLFSSVLTLMSLIWFLIHIFRGLTQKIESNEIFPLSLMFFGVCFSITAGIGRGYMGDLALGPRFQPLVMTYWVGFVTHIGCFLSRKCKDETFYLIVSAFVIPLILSSIYNMNKTGRRLTEDHARFAKMQMAYLTNNFGENAIYENMVPEWRRNSYAGIVATIPFLQKKNLGIFAQPLAQFTKENQVIVPGDFPACLDISISEKPRNEDPLIRNLFITSSQPMDQNSYPFLLVYKDSQLAGAAFRQRLTLEQRIKRRTSRWVGISNHPLYSENITTLAFNNERSVCRANTTYTFPK